MNLDSTIERLEAELKMLVRNVFKNFKGLASGVSRYGLYSTLHFAPGGVANRHNRLAILSHRALPVTKCNALYNPFNGGLQVE